MTKDEFSLRSGVFRSNLDYIRSKNSKAGLTYTLGVNKFADWTKEERRSVASGVKK